MVDFAGFKGSRTMCGSAVQACAHGVTPVTILSLSEPCVALTSVVITAPVSLVAQWPGIRVKAP